MNITKHGIVPAKEKLKPMIFKCSICGCEFTADEDEYYIHHKNIWDNFNDRSSTSTNTYVYNSTIMDAYICSCPECHKIVIQTKTRFV